MHYERRRPRQSFTRALKRIAERVDSHDTFEITYFNPILFKQDHSVVRVKALWAFGSWARGAMDCGDLDLMANISRVEGYMPVESAIRRVIVNRARDVRLYTGTPEKNSSKAVIEDAVLIWSPEYRDWRANIAAVKPDPYAKRYERPTDVLPLRNEQLCGEIDALEELIAQKNQGILTWEWHPFRCKVPDTARWSETTRSFLDRATRWRTGKKTRAALALVLDWFDKNDPIQAGRSAYAGSTVLWINGIRIHIGRPSVYSGWLDDQYFSGMMLVPHWSSRGPNGIWHIRRGEKHPMNAY